MYILFKYTNNISKYVYNKFELNGYQVAVDFICGTPKVWKTLKHDRIATGYS